MSLQEQNTTRKGRGYKNTAMHKNVTRCTRTLQNVRERCYFAMYEKLCTRGYAREAMYEYDDDLSEGSPVINDIQSVR